MFGHILANLKIMGKGSQMKKLSLFFLIVTMFCVNSLIIADDWSTWRGPNHNGISTESGWSPKSLEKLNKAWQINVGIGYSSVCVKNGSVYTIGNIDKKDIVYCLDEKTGKEIWRFTYECKPGSFPGPRTTPVYDKGLIYTTSRNGHVFCLNSLDGKVVWKRNIMKDHGVKNLKWGTSSSARIEGDILLLNANISGIALNKKTGKDVWVSKSDVGSYASPVIYTMNGKQYASIFSASKMYGVELKTGKVAWSYKWKTSYDIHGADPIFFDNKIFLSSGYKTGSALINITNNKPKKIWNNNNIEAQFGSCILIDGYIYGPKGNTGKKTSGLSCIDAKTGEIQWEQNLGFSSLIAVDNKLIIVNENGQLFIAEVNNKEYKELAQATVLQASKKNPVWTAPVFANKRIYCRNHQGDLVSISME